MEQAIVVQNVSKEFRLYHEKHSSLKERFIHLGRTPYEDFSALKDVSLDIEAGTTVGLMGHNGSGKSTLLKCIAGIIQPSTGEIRSRGRVAALLELGAGFHPDLTGRENVFLNASLLGLSNRYVEKKFDEIVAFSELEAFIDNQVKFYSSGMYVRLGFAVAVNMDPDILLVDEVLAVGDELFQRKCMERVRQFQREGRTIVVVSHSVDQIRQICDRAAVLDRGVLVANGEPQEAVRAFREHLYANYGVDEPSLADPDVPETPEEAKTQADKRNFLLKLTDVQLVHGGQPQRDYLLPEDGLEVRCAFDVAKALTEAVFGLAIYAMDGRLVFGTNTDFMGVELTDIKPGTGTFSFHLERLALLDGEYFITIGVHNKDGGVVYDWHEQEYHFTVSNTSRTVGLVHVPTHITSSLLLR